MRKDQKLGGEVSTRGALHLRTRRDLGDLTTTHRAPSGIMRVLGAAVRARLLHDDRPDSRLAVWRLSNFLRRLRQGERLPVDAKIYLGRLLGVAPLTSELRLRHYRPGLLVPERLARLQTLIRAGLEPIDKLIPEFGGELWDYGVVSHKVITTVGVNFLVDAFQDIVEIELMNFHGIGLGATGPVVGDTDIETELTTQYNPDNTRATGAQSDGASANIYRTIGTNTVDAAAAVVEHGILSNATVAVGTLWDRSTFTVINLANGDSLESTYDMTATAGG